VGQHLPLARGRGTRSADPSAGRPLALLRTALGTRRRRPSRHRPERSVHWPAHCMLPPSPRRIRWSRAHVARRATRTKVWHGVRPAPHAVDPHRRPL